MRDELFRCLRRAMSFDVVGARKKLSIHWPNMSRDEIGILQVANPDSAIVALCDQIDEAITVARLNVKRG